MQGECTMRCIQPCGAWILECANVCVCVCVCDCVCVRMVDVCGRCGARVALLGVFGSVYIVWPAWMNSSV